MTSIEQLVIEQLPSVRRMASRFRNSRLGYDDAFGAGSLALVESARRWDESSGVTFGAFASTRVRGAMLDALRGRQGRHIEFAYDTPVPDEEMAERFDDPRYTASVGDMDIRTAISHLNNRLRMIVLLVAGGHTNREISASLNVSESRVSQLMSKARTQLQREVLA